MLKKRWVAFLVAFIAMVFGGLCLNYTPPGKVEHHQEWAAEHGLPPPNGTIPFIGGASLLIAGVLFGRASRRA